MKYILFFFLIFLLSHSALLSQDPPSNEEEYDSLYALNIKMSRINGVYIPGDLNEAFDRLKRLSPAHSIEKFKSGEERMVSQKLHFGIGRWMIINWNFYEGSRFSHYLKEKGLLHPDDMAQFVLRTFHRHLNGKSLNESEIIDELEQLRKKEIEEVYKN